jgi:hypothetical protein
VFLLAGAGVVIALVAGGVVTAGRGGDEPPGRTALVAATGEPATPGAGPAAAAPLTPADLSLQLQALLGQHSILAADMMRGRLRDDPDLAQAANAALGRNTDAMGKLVGSAFGSRAAQAFTPLWGNHVTALFNYSRGLAEDDDAVTAQAKVAVTTFEGELAAFFAGASQGRLTTAAARGAVTTHITHLLDQADKYAAGDYTGSDAAYRRSYAHAFELGKALASTLLPPDAAAVLGTPAWRLRSALTQLLGEHASLAVAAMRAGATDAPDFAAAAASINGNTTDLTGAIDVLFGPAAATSFQSMWADHIDLLVQYSAAIAKGDDGAKTRIAGGLNGFEGKLAAFLSTATGDELAAGALATALQSHDTMLRQQVDAFVAKDYRASHDIAYSTYQEMVGLAGQLSDAFGVEVASRLPVGAADTGRGGAAAAVGGK